MATRDYSIPIGRNRATVIYTDAMSKMYGLVPSQLNYWRDRVGAV